MKFSIEQQKEIYVFMEALREASWAGAKIDLLIHGLELSLILTPNDGKEELILTSPFFDGVWYGKIRRENALGVVFVAQESFPDTDPVFIPWLRQESPARDYALEPC